MPAIKKVCAHFVEVCRKMGLLATASVAIDGSKFKAVNNRDKNFTKRQSRAAAHAIGGECRALSRAARYRRPAGAVGNTGAKKDADQRTKLKNLTVEMAKLEATRNRFWRRPISRSRSPIPTAVRWPRAGVVLASSATTCRPAVDTEDHLIVAHEVTTAARTGRNLQTWPRQAKAVLEADKLELSPIAATSRVKKSWRASNLASR